jgi:hypothetical protein
LSHAFSRAMQLFPQALPLLQTRQQSSDLPGDVTRAPLRHTDALQGLKLDRGSPASRSSTNSPIFGM